MQDRHFLLKVVLAFAGIYVIWGTTYLAIAFAIQTLPPFASAAIRFLLAGALLYGWLRLREPQPFKGLNIGGTALCGVLLLSFGNGLVVWAQQGVPTGIAALVVASMPILVLMLDWMFFSKRAPTLQAAVGITIALAGVVTIIAYARSLSGDIRPMHLVALLGAVLGWSIGTLVQRRTIVASRIFNFTCLQMLSGGAFLVLMAALDGEWQRVDLSQVSLPSALAVGYLIVFGSIVALSCYLWLLSHVPAQKVTTYALVNPVVALLLGSWILQERITPLAMLATVLVLVGVALVLFQGRRRTEPVPVKDGNVGVSTH